MTFLNILHPDFKLDNLSFSNKDEFLDYIHKQYPEHFVFLNKFFDKTESIQVSTSGSTGKPKLIPIRKSAMLKSAEATGIFFNLPSETTALNCLSSNYIAGKMMWVRALHLGWQLTVVPTDSTPLQHTESNFDFAAMVPLQVQNSLKELQRIDQLIIGGAPISLELKNSLLLIPTKAYQTYGMTETITHIAVKKIAKKETFYKALPEVSFDVDARNCLVINVPKLLSEPVITNDIVVLHSPTTFQWIGRYDNVINSGGIKLFPEQIENKLAAFIKYPFFIGSLQDTVLGQKMILLIESNNKLSFTEEIWQKAGLTQYEIPKDIYYIHKFLYSNNGKLLRQKTIDELL